MYCALHASRLIAFLFFFNDTATTEIYTLSLHDALPILHAGLDQRGGGRIPVAQRLRRRQRQPEQRSEEHTSELQSQSNLVCRLLLEKKKTVLLETTSALLQSWLGSSTGGVQLTVYALIL